MRISAKAEYACLSIIELARPGSLGVPKRIREIAASQGIPERYLVQILLQLKAAGLVSSARGSEGGYQLARGADEITVADVIAAVDGPGDGQKRAGSLAAELLADLLERARAAERSVLAEATIGQIADRIAPQDWVL